MKTVSVLCEVSIKLVNRRFSMKVTLLVLALCAFSFFDAHAAEGEWWRGGVVSWKLIKKYLKESERKFFYSIVLSNLSTKFYG
jgi:hypothetical protein